MNGVSRIDAGPGLFVYRSLKKEGDLADLNGFLHQRRRDGFQLRLIGDIFTRERNRSVDQCQVAVTLREIAKQSF